MVLSCAYPFFVSAQDKTLQQEIDQAVENYQERSWELGIAAGYGVKTNPLVNADDIPMYAALNIAWYGKRFFFDNGDFGAMLYEADKWSVNTLVHINNERLIYEWMSDAGFGAQFLETVGIASDFHASEWADSELLPEQASQDEIELTKRSMAVDGGIELLYSDEWGDLQLQVLSDISFTHKGFEVWGSYGYHWSIGRLKIAPTIGFHWKSRRLLDYYYGVRPEEAEGNRIAYQADSGVNGFFRLSISYALTNHWGIVGLAEYESLSRSVRQSPLVDRSSVETLFIGLMYHF